MKITTYILFLSIMPTASLFCQKEELLKKEAMDFSLSIMKDYFGSDCNKLYTKFSVNLYYLEEETYINEEQDQLEISVCEEMLETARKFRNKTFEDYQKDYHMQLFTKNEFEKEYQNEEYFESDLDNFELLESDFFILPIEGFKLKEEYVWFELELLVIRKIKSKWFIVAWL